MSHPTPIFADDTTPVSLACGRDDEFRLDPETAPSKLAPPPPPPPPSHFPPELWLSIFSYLEKNDLKAITYTSSPFRLLAQPLIFRVLDVCPFFLAYNTDRPIHRPRRYLQWTLERLNFYISPNIAPHVKQLWISPYSRNGFPSRRLTDDLDPALIISAIIDALPNFPNIKTLSWHCIDIQPSWWMAIQQLPLKRLWINSCTILSPPPPTSLRPFTPQHSLSSLSGVTHLDLDQWAWEGRVTNHVSIHEERLNGVDPLIIGLAIQPDIIRTASVPRHDTALHLLSLLAHLGTDLTASCSLTSLTIPYSSTRLDDFIPALIHTPALRGLHILPPSDDPIREFKLKGKLPTSSIPHLDTYEGPYHLLPVFANIVFEPEFDHPQVQSNNNHSNPSRRLRSIKLWGLDDHLATTVCDPRRLVPILEGLARQEAALEVLERVNLLLTHLTIDLVILLTRFRHLQEITIESQDGMIPARVSVVANEMNENGMMELSPDSPITSLFAILHSYKFPASLKLLILATHLKNADHLDTKEEKLEAARFLERLGRTNTQLDRIHLSYGTYWTGTVEIEWHRKVFWDKCAMNWDWGEDGGSCKSPSASLDLGSSGTEEDVISRPSSSSSSTSASSSPVLSRISTSSSLSSNDSDTTQVAVEKFLALPSRTRITTNVELGIGRMIIAEQKRAVLLPERSLPVEEAMNASTRSKAIIGGRVMKVVMGGMKSVWSFAVGRVKMVVGGTMGLVRG